MPGCAHCGVRLEVVGNQVGRRDCCPQCGADLHSCANCRHFDPNVAKQCKEPFAEVPLDKESANFCDFYQISEGGVAAMQSHAAAVAAAEALFRKNK